MENSIHLVWIRGLDSCYMREEASGILRLTFSCQEEFQNKWSEIVGQLNTSIEALEIRHFGIGTLHIKGPLNDKEKNKIREFIYSKLSKTVGFEITRTKEDNWVYTEVF